MTSRDAIYKSIRKIESIPNQNEKMYKILEEYFHLFPMLNAYLFRYSPLGFLSEGIIKLSNDGLEHIRGIRDEVKSPIILSSIQERKAKYCAGIEYLKQKSSKFINSANSLVILPIYLESITFGYICSTEFKEGTKFDDELLSSLTLYGQLVGKLIISVNKLIEPHCLAKRELEVLRRIAWGESTKELASSLGISELTANQYVKNAVKKLGTNNRTHAIAELYRRGILF